MTRYRLSAITPLLALALSTFCIAPTLKFASAQEPSIKSYQAITQQAEAKMTAQEWPEAAKLWEKITEMNPYLGNNWSQLGLCYLRARDYRKAIPAYEKVIELGSGYPFNAAYNIACSHALLGEKEKALDWLGRSLDMGFRNLGQLQRDPDLQSLHNDERFKKLAATADTSKMTRDEGWRYDLWLLARELKRIHYDLFKSVSKQDYDAYVSKLHNDIPRLTDRQIEVGFMKLMRMAGDGHTRISPNYTRGPARKGVPVQFYFFTEGLFIIAAQPQYSDLLGAQIIRIGDHTVDKVMESLDQIISRDNSIWLKLIGPGYMQYPQILNGLGLIAKADTLPLTVKDATGKTRTVDLPADAGMPDDTWINVRKDSGKPEPLYLKKRNDPYWFEYLADSKTVYFQYNQVRSDSSEPLDKFCERLFKFIEENPVDRLVIDMRWNSGGNNFLNRPLTHGLIRCDKINQRGKLFVIVGRNTFSAAMCGVTHIERHATPIFVGEPTGSSPNFVGETIQVNLPYTRMQGSISDLYWQNSIAMDYRTWIAPQVYAPPSFELYRANRDPAMEAIMAYNSGEN